MNRQSFIKNSLMALAVALLPKILRPMEGELQEEVIDVHVKMHLYVSSGDGLFVYNGVEDTTLKIPRAEYDDMVVLLGGDPFSNEGYDVISYRVGESSPVMPGV